MEDEVDGERGMGGKFLERGRGMTLGRWLKCC